jgi:hypothetical protein
VPTNLVGTGARWEHWRSAWRSARGLPGADDGGHRVRVDRVGRLNFDLVEARPAQRRTELGCGECAGDAAGPGGHVGLGRVVEVGRGDDIGDREAPAGP